MKAMVYKETGDASVIQLEERTIPVPAAGQVRIRIVVSGVNPTDWKFRRGVSTAAAVETEQVPNQDGSGVIDAVGPGVREFAIGDRVWLAISAFQRPAGGTAQQFTVLPTELVFHLPAVADFDLGASLGVPAITAHRTLTVAEGGPTRLSPGALKDMTVLVAGGAGAVGHAAIQLARWAGATVISTVSSTEKAALATAAGAHHTINYRTPDATAEIRKLAPNGIDLIIEVAPAANSDLDLAVLKTRGTIVIYANTGGPILSLDLGRNMSLNARYQFVLLYTIGQAQMDAAAADIAMAIADGALPIGEAAGLPLHRFTLEQTADAHTAVEAGIVGKVLIDVSAP